ncbi:MAG: TatD family hydrolase [Bacteroidota bacterium]
MLVDTHAHLTSEQFDPDRDEVIRRALDAGVEWMVNPATDPEDSRRALALAEREPAVFACVGLHPHQAGSAGPGWAEEMERMARHERVVGIGEIGLDYHYLHAPPDLQKEVFREQLAIAARLDLPVVVHTRESLGDALLILEEFTGAHPSWRTPRGVPPGRYPGPRGVFHCFSGDRDAAWRLIRMGFFISFPGILTFPNASGVRETAAALPVQHLLVETDCPYMSPVPHRGKRNEPRHALLVAAELARLHGIPEADVSRATTHGAGRLFRRGEPAPPEIVYRLGDSLYINLTIRCNADCVFCDRKGEAVIKGYNLRLQREPAVEEVTAAIGDPGSFREVVFCGYGEPTIRLEELKAVAQWVKARGGRTRLNTNGHGSVINGRDIVPELVGLIDAVSISLNATDAGTYGSLMRLDGPRFFAAMLDFARACVRLLGAVTMTVVAVEDLDLEKARRIAEEDVGARFQVRPLF